MDNQEVTVSIGEAAKELGVSVDTVRRWADSEKLKYIRAPSGHRRFYLVEIPLKAINRGYPTLQFQLPVSITNYQ